MSTHPVLTGACTAVGSADLRPLAACAATLPQYPAVLARTTARLLGACAGAAGAVGLLCAAGAMAALLMRVPGPVAALCAAVLVLLPIERLLWLRVRFDAGLFTDLARALDRTDEAPSAGATLDAALHALQLRGPAGAPRPLIDRAHGARRLMQWHALVALAQFALFVSAQALALFP